MASSVGTFLGSFIQYAFRVYGQSEGLKAPAQWTKIHANSLEAIANGNVAIDIDTRGRLILLDSSTSTNRLDIDADGFHETIVIARDEARAALLAARSETRDQLIAELGSWDLQRESPTIVVPPLPPEPAVEHDPGSSQDYSEHTN